MQIRFANRQDEAGVRALLEDRGVVLDLGGVDKDLHNLDQGYFGQDGIFVVAEDEGKVIAFAGARKLKSDNNTLELKRLYISKHDNTTARGDIREQFLAIIKNHAYQMDFKTISAKDGLV